MSEAQMRTISVRVIAPEAGSKKRRHHGTVHLLCGRKRYDPVSAALWLGGVRTTGDRKGGAPQPRAELEVSSSIVPLQGQRCESPSPHSLAQRLSVTGQLSSSVCQLATLTRPP